MVSKSLKTTSALITLSFLFSTCYPISEKGARNYSIAGGILTGLATGAAAGYATYQFSEEKYSYQAGVPVGLIGAALAYYLINSYLYQYTPTPKLENARALIRKLNKDSAFANDFLGMSQKDLTLQLASRFGATQNMEQLLAQFEDLKTQLKHVNDDLKQVTNDLDRDELSMLHKKLKDEVYQLKAYLNIRIAVITMAFVSTDKLVNQNFKNYSDFSSNSQFTLKEANNHLEELYKYLTNTENILGNLRNVKSTNSELVVANLSFEELDNTVSLLKNIISMRIAQIAAFSFEYYISTDTLLSKWFTNEYEVEDTLSAITQVSWPLVLAKQNLHSELSKLNDAYKIAYKAYNSINKNQYGYKAQSLDVINTLQAFINAAENKLLQITRCKDYPNQIGLYEQHIEMEKQRKLQQELFERQQALERQKLAEQREHERRLQEERLAQERQLAYKKQYQEERLAAAKIENERILQEQKLAHEKELVEQLNQQKQIEKQNSQAATPNTTYNTFYTTVTTPVVQPEPVYQVVTPAPSAPPVEPEEAHLFGLTTPEYNPNYTPSAPPIEEDADQPPSYGSMYPSVPSAPPVD